MEKDESTYFDAIVIGSGIGGMAAAGLLARVAGKKVLVLERHWELGGLTHVFRRDSFSWDVGVHYVGQVGEGSMARSLFDYLTEGKLKWNAMPRDFERFRYPGIEVKVPDESGEYLKRLSARFPGNERALRRYFRGVRRAARWHVLDFVARFLPAPIALFPRLVALTGRREALRTTSDFLRKVIPDQRLQAVLATQWGDYGLPPSESAFAIHALIVSHYLGGAFFPQGGAGRISRYIEALVEKAGGLCRVNQEATKILVDKGKVTGVIATDLSRPDAGQTIYRAPIVVSDIGALSTYSGLLADEPLGRVRSDLERIPAGYSAVTLYVALKEAPAKLGVSGENWWINESFDHDDLAGQTSSLLAGRPERCYVSFPSMKSGETIFHTAEIISFVLPAAFDAWKHQSWRERDAEYYELKERISRGLLDLAEKHIPGFQALSGYTELSTPLSVERFTGHGRGEFYGAAATPARYALPHFRPTTPIRNLYLSGSDASSLGVVGALMGGVAAASRCLGPLGFFRIMAAAGRKADLRAGNDAGVPRRSTRDKSSAILVAKTPLADSIFDLEFELSEDRTFSPGQYARLQVNETEWRDYSIVSLEGRRIRFIVNARGGGLGSRRLRAMAVGETTLIQLPFGDYRLRESGNRRIFVATSTGLAPLIPMLERLCEQQAAGRINLVFGCRTVDENLAAPWIRRFKDSLNLEATVCISGESPPEGYHHGRVGSALGTLTFDPEGTDFYVSGNSAMVREVGALLRRRGARTVYTENY